MHDLICSLETYLTHFSFENKDVATSAMSRSQGFPLFDKPMDIQYALEPAYAVSALQGSDKLENHKRKRGTLLDFGLFWIDFLN